MNTKLDDHADALLEQLEGLSDEVRLKLHLASVDARDKWRTLEPEIADAKNRAKIVSEASLDALRDMKKALQKFSASL